MAALKSCGRGERKVCLLLFSRRNASLEKKSERKVVSFHSSAFDLLSRGQLILLSSWSSLLSSRASSNTRGKRAAAPPSRERERGRAREIERERAPRMTEAAEAALPLQLPATPARAPSRRRPPSSLLLLLGLLSGAFLSQPARAVQVIAASSLEACANDGQVKKKKE